MSKSIFYRPLAVLLCIVLLPSPPARGDSLQKTGNEIVAGIAAVGAAIVVVAIVLIVHHKSATVKGCVASGPNNLELTNSSDHSTYDLEGATSDIKPGELVKVKGKKKSGHGSTRPTFTVRELSEDYGACPTPR